MSADGQLSSIPLDTLYRLLEPVTAPPSSPKASFTNWGLSYGCTPLAVFVPESERHCELILELARREGKRVRAVGVGHSPSDLACTSEFMVRTEKLNKIIEVSISFRLMDNPISIPWQCASPHWKSPQCAIAAVPEVNSITSNIAPQRHPFVLHACRETPCVFHRESGLDLRFKGLVPGRYISIRRVC